MLTPRCTRFLLAYSVTSLAIFRMAALPQTVSAGDADKSVIAQLFSQALADDTAYRRLEELTHRFPGRLSGTQTLEEAIL